MRGRISIVTKFKIEKFEGDWKSREEAISAGVEPYEVIEFEKNIGLNEGIEEAWKLICGTGGTAFDSSNAHIGVGDGTTAEDASQTGLQGTNKCYKGMDAGYPSVSGTKATFRATFGSDDANFSWQEITVANGSDDSAKNLIRKVQDMGTKTSGSTWIATVEITMS
mgnify:CR=1 FL=1